jgi:pimeloyl-ACP methyl ester carboxylesterase
MTGDISPTQATPSGARAESPWRQEPGALRLGSGEPLVLLHGVLGGAFMWREVMPQLAASHDVIALTALGHHGGPACRERPARIAHVVDDAERAIDRLGFARVHLAGNSMGGWVALELARRGRARSVCALSPAGMWGTEDHSTAIQKLRTARRLAGLTRALLPWLAHFQRVRRFALRDNALHAGAVSAQALVELSDGALGCAIGEDLLATPEHFEQLEINCPVLVAWSGADKIFPPEVYAARARALVPGAQHVVLENVGHVPMLDAPGVVADTILASTGMSAGQ